MIDLYNGGPGNQPTHADHSYACSAAASNAPTESQHAATFSSPSQDHAAGLGYMSEMPRFIGGSTLSGSAPYDALGHRTASSHPPSSHFDALLATSAQPLNSLVAPAPAYFPEHNFHPVLPPLLEPSHRPGSPRHYTGYSGALLSLPSPNFQTPSTSSYSSYPSDNIANRLDLLRQSPNSSTETSLYTPRTTHLPFRPLHGNVFDQAPPRRFQNMGSPYAESSMAASNRDRSEFPWGETVVYAGTRLTLENGAQIIPVILCRMEKGFEVIKGCWTAYRRNYFAVSCAFILDPAVHSTRVYLNGTPVQAFGMRISAAVDDRSGGGLDGRNIDLIQFTAKRDNGDKKQAGVVRVAPGMPLRPGSSPSEHMFSQFSRMPYGSHSTTFHGTPYLPLQSVPEDEDETRYRMQRYTPDHPPLVDHTGDSNSKQHTFDRIQFKSATANNGKRRATQQFFHVKVELLADIRSDRDKAPVWRKIATRYSAPVVVRGRSPNHYKVEDAEEDPEQNDGSGAAGQAPRYDTPRGPAYPHYPSERRDSEDRDYPPNYGAFREYGTTGLRRSSQLKHDATLMTPDPEKSTNPASPLHPLDRDYGSPMRDVKDETSPRDYNLTDNYTYMPGPLYSPLSNPLSVDEQQETSHGMRSPLRAVSPRSLPPWHFERSVDPMQGYPTSRGLYPSTENILDAYNQ